jgi:hypothetical protein
MNKYLAMMNHASEKSKRESWRRDTECDGEQQVDVQFEKSHYKKPVNPRFHFVIDYLKFIINRHL